MSSENLLQKVKITDVIPSPDNPRTVNTEDPATKELARSIKEMGMVVPIMLRPHPKKKGKYDLRAGARRLAAAILAGLTEIPAIVREMSDEEADKITVVENLQREDLHPLEEARGIRTLINHGWELASIASNLGKSVSWVVRRAQLTKLSAKWLKELEKKKGRYADWSVAHIELIARLAPEAQDAFLEYRPHYYYRPSLSDLKSELAAYTRTLGGAAWKLDETTLVAKAGACTTCRKRASKTPGLFDDVEEEEDPVKALRADRCLDATCWERKASAYLERRKIELSKKHDDLLLLRDKEGCKDGDGTDRLYKYERVKKSARGAKPALIIDRGSGGQLTWVKISNHFKDSGVRPRPLGENGKALPKPLKERRKALDKRRAILILNMLKEKVRQAGAPGGFIEAAALVVYFGSKTRTDSPDDSNWKRFNLAVKGYKDDPSAAQDDLQGDLWAAVMPVLVSRITYPGHGDTAEYLIEAERICELLGLSMNDFIRQAAMEIPEPKIWRHLNADGTPKAKTKKKNLKEAKRQFEEKATTRARTGFPASRVRGNEEERKDLCVGNKTRDE